MSKKRLQKTTLSGRDGSLYASREPGTVNRSEWTTKQSQAWVSFVPHKNQEPAANPLGVYLLPTNR